MKIKTVLINSMFIAFLITGCSGFKYLKSNECQNDITNIFSNLYQKELRSVVQVEVLTNKLGKMKQGSGVIISKDGYILTNNHVVEDSKEVIVLMSDLKDYDATLVGTDSRTDIALLKINSDDNFIAVKIGNSDNVKIGEWVTTMGSPFGLQNSITAGIVSGKNRSSDSPGLYGNFIQVDAAINPGNSGGPLFNLKGEVIGINTMIIARDGTNSNVGFAIPINTAMFIVSQLKKYGEIIRGRIGVIIQNITSELKKQHKLKSRAGAFVKDVPKNSPANKANLKVGDIIIKFNDKKIRHIHELVCIVSISPIGKKLEIIVLRNNERKILTIILEKSDPSNVISVQELQNKFGFFAIVIDHELAKKLAEKNNATIKEIEGKITISKVVTESSACLSGLKKDDIIMTISNKKIKSVDDYAIAILKLSLKKPFLMTVLREGYIKYLVLSIKAGEAL